MGDNFSKGQDTAKAVAYRHEPYDIDIEQALLGAMLVDNRKIDLAAAEIEAHHFYDPLHQRLFDMIVCLAGEGDVTPLILHSVMKADPGVIETGGQAYFDSLRAAAPSLPNVRDYANILRDLAFRRKLITIGGDLVNFAYDAPFETTAQTIADNATEALLQAGTDTAEAVLTPYEIAQQTIRQLEGAKNGNPLPVVKTGLEILDREIGGLRAQELVVILGKSGMGKSAFMGSTALNMVLAGTPVIVFSLEMTKSQWIERMVCDFDFRTARTAMWYSRVRNGRLSDEEFSRFVLASQNFKDLPLEVIDEDGLSMAQIAARTRAFKAKMAGKHQHPDGTAKPIVAMIDYLQIVEPADPREPRERQVNRMARGAKSLAKKAHCVVVVGSQMNEADEARSKEDRRPRASDARESKGIMNEADQMFAPWRPAVAVDNRKPLGAKPGSPDYAAWESDLNEVVHQFDLLGLKNRHGRRFDIALWAEMGANAVRDYEPSVIRTAADQAAADLLAGLQP